VNAVKIAVAGKGGVGKTFISSTLCRLLASDGYNVLAVDADPNFNLAYALGIPREVADNIIPLTVNDIVDRFGVNAPGGVKLLVMGTVRGGGTGCMCGANALLRVLVQHLLIQRGEALIMDMVAGLEHLGRGTARRMDAMLVVVEPRMKSMDTMRRILRLAEEIEIKEVLAVGNKVATEAERRFIMENMEAMGVPVVAIVPYDEAVGEADMKGVPTLDYDADSPAVQAVRELKDYLVARYKP
jgi:CO dehydrogenase maturation factor